MFGKVLSVHDIKANGGGEAELRAFLNLALHRDERSVSHTLVTLHPSLLQQKETPLLTELDAGWNPLLVWRPHLLRTEFTILGLSGPWSGTTPTAVCWFVKLFGTYNLGYLQGDELVITW